MTKKGVIGRAEAGRRRWLVPEYREKQLAKLAIAQHKEAEQKKLRARSKPIHLNGSRLQRARLIEKHGNKCKLCGQGPEWNGKELVLQAHHLSREELFLLCPNCHTQTEGYNGRGFDRKTRKR